MGCPWSRLPKCRVCEQLVVGDGAGGLEKRVEKRGGVSLGKDQMIVVGIAGIVEVVTKMLGEEDRHQVSRGH